MKDHLTHARKYLLEFEDAIWSTSNWKGIICCAAMLPTMLDWQRSCATYSPPKGQPDAKTGLGAVSNRLLKNENPSKRAASTLVGAGRQ